MDFEAVGIKDIITVSPVDGTGKVSNTVNFLDGDIWL